MVPNIPQVPATSYIIHCTELHWGHLWFMCMSSKSVKIDPFFFVSFSWLIGGTMLPILTADHQW